MNSEDRNENLVLNQMAGGLSLNTGLVAAGAAVLGGALYYYLNSANEKKGPAVIDYKNQTREVAVSCHISLVLLVVFKN